MALAVTTRAIVPTSSSRADSITVTRDLAELLGQP
jgi:hypothetical protein